MRRTTRWTLIVGVVAAAAASAVVVGLRQGRSWTARPPVTLPPPPAAPETVAVSRPPAKPGEGPSRRYLAVTLALAVAVAVGVVATAQHRPVDVGATTPTISVNDRIGALSTTSAWTPPAEMPVWTPPAATPSPPVISPAATTPAPVPVGGVLPPDGSVMMRGDSGEDMTLTVTRIDNPAPSRDLDNPSGPELPLRLGYRLVAIHVLVKNTGGVPFLTDIEKHTWLVDKTGRTYPRHAEMTEARQLHPASTLSPESWNGRVIVFEIKGNMEIRRFRLSLHPGSAKQTQDWRLT